MNGLDTTKQTRIKTTQYIFHGTEDTCPLPAPQFGLLCMNLRLESSQALLRWMGPLDDDNGLYLKVKKFGLQN